jgi:hypothetical protein
MDLETFEKLVEKHLFILESHKLDESGMPKLQIFGIEALYKQLMLGGVINWVAVSHTNPPEGEYETYFVRDDAGFMYERNWKGHFWEGDYIVNEPKVTHWTIVKPPCL